MKISIRGWLGVKNFETEVDDKEVVFISGSNSDGKTSVLTGIASALTRNHNPAKLPVRNMGLYCNTGSAKSKITIGDGGTWSVEVTDKGVSVMGEKYTPPTAHPAVVGLENPIDWNQKKWMSLFDSVSLSEESLMEVLIRDFGYDKSSPEVSKLKPYVLDIMKHSEAGMVDELVRNWKATMSKAIGTWEGAVASTGEAQKYGTTKGSEWSPALAGEALKTTTMDNLETSKAKIQKQLIEMHKTEGYDEGAKAQLESSVKKLPDLHLELENLISKEKIATEAKEVSRQIIEDLNQKKAKLRQLQRNGERERDFLQIETNVKEITCPACGEELRISQGEVVTNKILEANKKLDAEKLRKVKTNLNGITDEIKEVDKELIGYEKIVGKDAEVYAELHKVKSEIEIRQKDAARLIKFNDLKPINLEDIEIVENQLKDLEKQIVNKQAWNVAQKAHKLYIETKTLVNSIEKGGISKQMAQAGIEQIKVTIKRLSELTGYDIEMDSDCQLFCNDRTPLLCAENENWILRFAATLAIAQCTNAPMILIDKTDVLDAKNYKIICKVMERWREKIGIPVMLFGTELADAGNSFKSLTIKNGKLVEE